MTPPTRTATGFTLVELIVVLALAGPFLLVLGSAGTAAIGSFAATERSAKGDVVELQALAELERVLRSGRRRTLQTMAARRDVLQGRAAAVGDWFSMPLGEPRTELEVASLRGDPAPALQLPSRQVQLLFVRDPAERPDGSDDDGDGLVDEGTLQLVRGEQRIRLLTDVEECTFERVANAIQITLRCARRVDHDTWRRWTVEHTVVLNNP